MQRHLALSLAALLAASIVAGRAMAAVATGVIGVSMIIDSSCTVATSAGALSVQCAHATPYTVSLASGGILAAATLPTKATGSYSVSDAIYRVSGRSLRRRWTVGDGPPAIDLVKVTVAY